MKKITLLLLLLLSFASCVDERRQEDYMQGYVAGYLRACKEANVGYDFEKVKQYWELDSANYFKYEIRK